TDAHHADHQSRVAVTHRFGVGSSGAAPGVALRGPGAPASLADGGVPHIVHTASALRGVPHSGHRSRAVPVIASAFRRRRFGFGGGPIPATAPRPSRARARRTRVPSTVRAGQRGAAKSPDPYSQKIV